MKLQKRQLRFEQELTRLTTQEILIQALNGDASLSAKSRKRVSDLVELTQRAVILDSQSHSKERAETLEQINQKLRRYRWSPELEKLGGLPGLNLTYWHDADTLEERSENWCIQWITELVRRRNILRVRRCAECGRWLWAIKEHQTHCSANCRQKHASHRPDFKEQRRLYMIGYRVREKEQAERAKQRARRRDK